jgi:hypothetical protein
MTEIVMRKLRYTQIVLLVTFGIVRGDTLLAVAERDNGGYLSLRGIGLSNTIVIDSSIINSTSADSIPLAAGRHQIRIYENTRWEGPMMDTTVEVIGQEIIIHVPISSGYTLLSGPVQASIKLNDSIIGHTPLYLTSPFPPNARVILTAAGYEEAAVPLLKYGVTVFDLKILPAIDQHDIFPNDSHIGRHRDWIYTSLAAAVFSGVTAVYTKQKANYFDDQFVQSKDPSIRSKRDRYDIASGITLIATEVSFVVLSYFLLSQ